MTGEEIRELGPRLSKYLNGFRRYFVGTRGFRHLCEYVRGQLSPLERKNVEGIAKAAGVAVRTLQEFLSLLTWNDEGVVDSVQRRVGKKSAEARETIGTVDGTSYVKKGEDTACVQPQYCGASGKIDNCVVSIHLGYTDGEMQALVDSELYVPQSWAEDEARRRKVEMPAEMRYRPSWEIALGQIRRARGNGIRFDWMTADEEYGKVPEFLKGMEEMGQRYVMEIPKIASGWIRQPEVIEDENRDGGEVGRARKKPRLAKGEKPARVVHELFRSSGVFRHQEWAVYRVKDTQRGPEVWRVKETVFYQNRDGLPSKALRLIVTEKVLTGENKYFLSDAGEDVPMETLLRVAFSRWHVEKCFEDYKGELGMDHFEVRKWKAVRRHLTMTLVSGLFLETECIRLREKKSVGIGLSDSESRRCPDRDDPVHAPESGVASVPSGGGDSRNPTPQRRGLTVPSPRTVGTITPCRNLFDSTPKVRHHEKVALSC